MEIRGYNPKVDVSLRGAFLAAAVYAMVLLLFARPFLMMIGGDSDSIDFAVAYTVVTMVIGGIPTILSATSAHLIRSTGNSKVASFGVALGAVLNMALDPLFMFVILPKGNEVLGAAIATAISNAVSLLYFVFYILCHKENPVYCFTTGGGKNILVITVDILKSGIPSFFLLAAGQISNFFLNGMIADMGASSAVAGIGVVRKIDSFAYAVNQGITQGMLPIVSYCYASGRISRMKSVILFSSVCTEIFSLFCTACSWLFAPQLVRFFIRDADTILYGSAFLRVLCIAISIYPMLFIIIAVFQAAGQSLRPFLLSLLHKGSLDIVLFFLIRKWFGTEYILWASPIMEAFALLVGIIMIVRWLSSLKNIRLKKEAVK